jgi:hypothetical protein
LRFGAWNARSLYRVGSLKAVASELAKYNSDLVTVQEVRWDNDGRIQQRIIHFSIKMGISTAERMKFVNDRMYEYIVLRRLLV